MSTVDCIPLSIISSSLDHACDAVAPPRLLSSVFFHLSEESSVVFIKIHCLITSVQARANTRGQSSVSNADDYTKTKCSPQVTVLLFHFKVFTTNYTAAISHIVYGLFAVLLCNQLSSLISYVSSAVLCICYTQACIAYTVIVSRGKYLAIETDI